MNRRLYTMLSLIVLTGMLLSTKAVYAAPTADNTIYLPFVEGFFTAPPPDPRRGPITSDECVAIGGQLSAQYYVNGTGFVAIDKQRHYIPRATEALNANFFPGGTIDSRTGSSPVCYFPGNYLVVWPNPNGPATDDDLTWFVDHSDEVIYLEFPGGRPEVDAPTVSSSNQSTETLYAMVVAPVLGAIDDIPIIGQLRIGGQVGDRLMQIGEIGSGRLSLLTRAAGHAYSLTVLIDRIWTSTTLGTTIGIVDMGGDTYYIPNTMVTDLSTSVYLWHYDDVMSESGKYPIGQNIGVLLPEGNQNWGWLFTTIPQFTGHTSAFPFKNIINFSSVELKEQAQTDIPDDEVTLEQQLEELNELARQRLKEIPVPLPPDPTSCPPQIEREVVNEAIAWIVMFTSIEGNAQLTSTTVRFFFEFVSNVHDMQFETRYRSLLRTPGSAAQEYSINTINGKYWAVYTVCSIQGGFAEPRYTFFPGAAFWGLSNNIDNRDEHIQYPFTEY